MSAVWLTLPVQQACASGRSRAQTQRFSPRSASISADSCSRPPFMILLSKQGPDVRFERDTCGRIWEPRFRFIGRRGQRRHAGSSRRVAHPPPPRYRHVHRELRARLRILERQRAPFEVGHKAALHSGSRGSPASSADRRSRVTQRSRCVSVIALPMCCPTIRGYPPSRSL